MRGALLFACQSRSISTVTTLLNAGASPDQFGSCSLNYANRYAPGILSSNTHLSVHTDTWENLYPIHIAIIDNDVEMLTKLLRPNTHELLTNAGFSPLHVACLLNRSLTMIEIITLFRRCK